jgi:PAS domain S-box-containing protein
MPESKPPVDPAAPPDNASPSGRWKTDNLRERAAVSEQRLQFALASGGLGIWDWDLVSGRTYYSKENNRILGYEDDEVLGNTSEEHEARIHPDDHVAMQALVQAHLRGESPGYIAEFRVRRKDGTYAWVESRGRVIEWEADGRPRRMIGTHIDISARKQAEAALLKSQRLLSEAERIGKVGGWEFSIATGEQVWTDETYRIHELDRTYGPTVDGGINFYTRESRPLIERAVREAIELGKSFDLELEIRTAKGNLRKVNAIGHADLEHGRVHGFFQDVTERRRAEGIRAARLRLMELAPTASLQELLVATLDEAGVLTGSTIGFYHFLDADQKTLSLQAWSTRTTEEFCTALGAGSHYNIDEAGVWVECVRQRRAVIHNEYGTLIGRRGLPPGHAEVLRELVVPIFRNGLIVAILGVGNKAAPYDAGDQDTVVQLADMAWDFAETRRVNDALLRSEDQLRAMTAAVPGVIYQFRRRPQGDLELVYVSPGFEALYEAPTPTLSHEMTALIDFIVAEDREAYRDSVERAGQDLRSWEQEYRIRTPGGRIKWVRGEARPERQTDGGILWSGHLSDITERKRTDEELQQYRHQLENLVAARTTELASARDAAENANRAKSTFLATVSHELRTPLNAIIGFSELMADGSLGNVGIEQRKPLSIIRRSSEELLALVQDILDVSSIEAGALVVQLGEVCVRPMLSEVCDAFQTQARERNLVLKPALCDDSIVARADRARLSQVVRNLLGNALKFTDHGYLQVRAKIQGGMVRIEVEDTGIGIPMDQQSILFQPFQRIDNKQGPLRRGTGLGLSICKRIVEAMGGTIGVDSEPGRGSRFWFTVPLAAPHQC